MQVIVVSIDSLLIVCIAKPRTGYSGILIVHSNAYRVDWNLLISGVNKA